MSISPAIRTEGLEKVLKNLNRQVAGIKGRTRDGLIAAGLLLEGRGKKNIPPHVITGNLMSSGFTTWSNAPFIPVTFKPAPGVDSARMEQDHQQAVVESAQRAEELNADMAVAVGFSAYYALYVHEDGITRNWTGVKFLERAAAESGPDILEEIKKRARI